MIVNYDILTPNERQGAVAHRLATSGFDIHSMRPWIGKDGKVYCNQYVGSPYGDRQDAANYKPVSVIANGTLLRDEWIAIDRALVGLAEKRLGGAQHLIDRGLTMDLDGMSYTMVEWRDYSDALEAKLDMRPVIRGEADRQRFTSKYLPLPIGYVDFEIDKRELNMSRRMGIPFDTMLIERAGRRLMEQTEERLFTAGKDYGFGDDNGKEGTSRGYLTHPNRNTVVLTDWTDDATTGEHIKNQVLAMIQSSLNDNFYGPWVLYVPLTYQTKLDDDYDRTTSTGTTIRQRLMEIDKLDDIRVIDTMPHKNVVLVTLEKDCVQLVRGLGLTVVQWAVEGEFLTHYKVLQIESPMLRATQDGKMGVVHGSAP